LLKVKLPFEPSSLAQAAGIGALSDDAFLTRSRDVNAAGKVYLIPALRKLGLTLVPTEANFVMIPLADEQSVNAIYNGLLKMGVIIRPLRAFGLPHCIRITIGTQSENERLVESLRKVLDTIRD
jgi:histidinol-phosphate aminotransferase